MGQAKQRAAATIKWLDGLSEDEKIVHRTAQDLFTKVIRPRNISGMCYHSVFFLVEFLKNRHGISAVPVIGYVNDRTDDIMISHAWLEFAGKKTDVSLGVTAHPDVSPAGEVIILDRVMFGGHTYDYHREMTPEGVLAMQHLRATGHRSVVDRKISEHQVMTARANNPALIRPYLDDEPNGFDYDKIADLLDTQAD